jgi:glutaminyl-tRNA synthetase
MGTRRVPFSREIYVDRDDFMEEPPKKFFRLAPGREVRLRFAYLVTCREVVKDEQGEVVELHCTYDPESRGGSAPDGRKVKGTIHWVSARHARMVELRLYDRLFRTENPEAAGHFLEDLNPDSLTILEKVPVEPALGEARPEEFFQFERVGYFVADRLDHDGAKPVFNRSVGLRDSWAKAGNR